MCAEVQFDFCEELAELFFVNEARNSLYLSVDVFHQTIDV